MRCCQKHRARQAPFPREASGKTDRPSRAGTADCPHRFGVARGRMIRAHVDIYRWYIGVGRQRSCLVGLDGDHGTMNLPRDLRAWEIEGMLVLCVLVL